MTSVGVVMASVEASADYVMLSYKSQCLCDHFVIAELHKLFKTCAMISLAYL